MSSRGTLSELTRNALGVLGPLVPTPAGYVSGIIRNMTQTPESSADPTTVTGQPRHDGWI